MRKGPLPTRLGIAFALALVLAGCTKGGQFDPTTIFDNDAFETKKKLKGDREPVFPGGVPGATTGVPPDLMKGYQPPADADADAPLPAAPPPPKEAAAAKPKPQPKPKVAAVPAQQKQDAIWNQRPAGPTRINVGGANSSAAPAQAASSQGSAQAPWPSPQAAPAPAPWPSAPPPVQQGTAWPNPPATTSR